MSAASKKNVGFLANIRNHPVCWRVPKGATCCHHLWTVGTFLLRRFDLSNLSSFFQQWQLNSAVSFQHFGWPIGLRNSQPTRGQWIQPWLPRRSACLAILVAKPFKCGVTSARERPTENALGIPRPTFEWYAMTVAIRPTTNLGEKNVSRIWSIATESSNMSVLENHVNLTQGIN